MKIGIIGAGVMGTFLGGILGKYNDVLIVGKHDKEISEIEISGKTNVKVNVDYTTDHSRLKNSELIIICTKSYDTREAISEINSYITDSALVLSLQNGLDNEKIISDYVEEKNVIGGITGLGVTYLEDGKVKHAGKGETIIGKYKAKNDRKIFDIKEVLEKSGLEVSVSDNIYGHIWKKVIINSSINPITALTGLKNGALLEQNNLHELLKIVCLESTKIAKEEVDLPSENMVEETEKIAKMTSENKSSMLQDIENKNKTEIECINGAIVSKGKKFGISTPYNETLFNLIKGKENEYL